MKAKVGISSALAGGTVTKIAVVDSSKIKTIANFGVRFFVFALSKKLNI
jgi:hypothetical protein